jgi:rod shape-determining protein MreD
MNPRTRRGLFLYAVVFIAAIAQAAWGGGIRFYGAQPDLLTAVAIVCALFCDANGGAGVGFVAGLLLASLAGPPQGGFGSLIVSRTLVGFAVGWLEERIERDNPFLAVAFVFVGTLLAESLFFLFAPQRHISHWARSLALTTLYNTILAYPLYVVVRRIVGERIREER